MAWYPRTAALRSSSTRLSASIWRELAPPRELEGDGDASGIIVSVSESESMVMGSEMFWLAFEEELVVEVDG